VCCNTSLCHIRPVNCTVYFSTGSLFYLTDIIFHFLPLVFCMCELLAEWKLNCQVKWLLCILISSSSIVMDLSSFSSVAKDQSAVLYLLEPVGLIKHNPSQNWAHHACQDHYQPNASCIFLTILQMKCRNMYLCLNRDVFVSFLHVFICLTDVLVCLTDVLVCLTYVLVCFIDLLVCLKIWWCGLHLCWCAVCSIALCLMEHQQETPDVWN
jgi:hypothetical protein